MVLVETSYFFSAGTSPIVSNFQLQNIFFWIFQHTIFKIIYCDLIILSTREKRQVRCVFIEMTIYNYTIIFLLPLLYIMMCLSCAVVLWWERGEKIWPFSYHYDLFLDFYPCSTLNSYLTQTTPPRTLISFIISTFNPFIWWNQITSLLYLYWDPTQLYPLHLLLIIIIGGGWSD